MGDNGLRSSWPSIARNSSLARLASASACSLRTRWVTSSTAATRDFGLPCASRTSETRSEEHTSELQSHVNLVCRLLLEKKKKKVNKSIIYYYTLPVAG